MHTIDLTTLLNFKNELRFIGAKGEALSEIILYHLYQQHTLHIKLSERVLKEGMPENSKKLVHLKQQIKRMEPRVSIHHNLKHCALFVTLQDPPPLPPSEFLGVLKRIRLLKQGESFSFRYSEAPGYFANPYQLKPKVKHKNLSFSTKGNYCYVTAN